jgi:predicted hydrocarbon binding protein
MKIETAMHSMAEMFNHNTDQRVRLREEADGLFWQIERCPLCWGRRTQAPCCHLEVGLLQETLFWISGGRNFEVQETTCVATGDECCTLRVAKRPLD